MTQPTVSKHWRKIGSQGLGFNPTRSTSPCYNNTTDMQYEKINAKTQMESQLTVTREIANNLVSFLVECECLLLWLDGRRHKPNAEQTYQRSLRCRYSTTCAFILPHVAVANEKLGRRSSKHLWHFVRHRPVLHCSWHCSLKSSNYLSNMTQCQTRRS